MNKNISYKFLENSQEILSIIDKHFDYYFWEDYSVKRTEYLLEIGTDFILFTIEDIPCALASVGEPLVHSIREDTKEIFNLDVEDNHFGRGTGIGANVVAILNTLIYKDFNLMGYSVSEAAKFWRKNSSRIDEDVYDSFEKEHIENGGCEDELFYDLCGLMEFHL